MSVRSDVSATLARLSTAWQERRFEELALLFDENAVLVLPGFSGRLEGRNAAVRSYREFMDSASVDEYVEEPAAIDVWGGTAVASYRWTMVWTSQGTQERASGYDLLVLARSGSSPWRVVWRTVTLDGGLG